MKKELAVVATFSIYPREREALAQIMSDNQFKSAFDAVRWMAQKSKTPGFEAPKNRNPNRKSV